ncbi:hypothetical protein Csa_002734 [Cucumis sativus]|uniref:Polymorphic antigen n=1 Tax=Cucumis sativus TaxID=3659 RepID=A0A0A0KMB8_CUCSA|nr:hypothetical protein Csa_002734 [Cucumis sativus]
MGIWELLKGRRLGKWLSPNAYTPKYPSASQGMRNEKREEQNLFLPLSPPPIASSLSPPLPSLFVSSDLGHRFQAFVPPPSSLLPVAGICRRGL